MKIGLLPLLVSCVCLWLGSYDCREAHADSSSSEFEESRVVELDAQARRLEARVQELEEVGGEQLMKVLLNLGSISLFYGEAPRAEQYFRRAVAEGERVLLPGDPLLYIAREKLARATGVAMLDVDPSDPARFPRRHFREVLAKVDLLLGSGDDPAAESLLLSEIGRERQPESRTSDSFERVGVYSVRLADLWAARGEHARAVPRFREAIVAFERWGMGRHVALWLSEAASARTQLARSLRALGEMDQAESAYLAALADWQRWGGGAARIEVLARELADMIRARDGETEEARRLDERAAEIGRSR